MSTRKRKEEKNILVKNRKAKNFLTTFVRDNEESIIGDYFDVPQLATTEGESGKKKKCLD